MRVDTGQIISLADYRPSDFILEEVDLRFELAPAATRVTARLALKRRPGSDPAAALELDGDELELAALSIDGIAADPSRFDSTAEKLSIRDLPEAAGFEISIVTVIDPEANSQLMGLYRSNGVYCSQCEAEGFRRITYFPDRPDVLARWRVTIIADRGENPLLLSNGNPVETGALEDGRHFSVWADPHPKPSYLFALVAGDLGVVEDSFTTASGRAVTLKIFVEHGKEARAAYAMDALKRSMRWDETRFGREYDLDIFMIVAVSDFNMGAMENKGLNIFNDKYILADPQTATDQDYANIETIVAHEYFHNWTGNRITCRDWFQLCLKEGLTVYRDHEFSADQRSRAVRRIAEVRRLKADQFPEDAGPLAHPVRPEKYREINNFYTTTVYEKGAEVTRMIATLLGPETFRRGMDLYFERHDGEAATVEDFVRVFEDASGRDLSQFRLWYSQAGTPLVTASGDYDATRRLFTLTLEQMVPATPGQPVKEAMHIPLSFALILPDGNLAVPEAVTGGEVSGDILHLTQRRQVFTFAGIGARPVLSLNRSFSAPINLHQEQLPAERVHIARHDSDLFSRWQALSDLSMPILLDAVAAARTGSAANVDPAFVEALLEAAGDDGLEPAFRAEILSLPGESDIAREIGQDADPDAIHSGRNAVRAAIAEAGRPLFADLYEKLRSDARYRPDAESAGRRALAHAALAFLSFAEATPERAEAAFAAADNMTDLSQALTLLAHRFPDAPETGAALSSFLDRFAGDALVIDKWFSIQATIPGDAALSRVEALMRHARFQPGNPNRVRALVGSFAFANPTGFNRADGEGYRLLADQVLAIDGRNPQLAARLLTALRSWRSLEAKRSEKAREALVTIDRAEGLSADTRDLVERLLTA